MITTMKRRLVRLVAVGLLLGAAALPLLNAPASTAHVAGGICYSCPTGTTR